MRFFTVHGITAAAGLLALVSLLRAQVPLVPPAQTHVAAIGTTPLRAPATADFAPAASFTLEGWLYRTGTAPFAWLMGKALATGNGDPFVSFALLMNEDGSRLIFAQSTGAPGSQRQITGPVLPLQTWTHVAAVLDSGTLRLFVNGQPAGSTASAGPPPSAPAMPFSVGVKLLADGRPASARFIGYARQLRFWSSTRMTAQIVSAAAAELPAERVGLVAAWPLDDATATARDLSGAGRTLATLAGEIVPVRTALLAAGPFFQDTVTPVTDGSLAHLVDGHPIDFDGDGDLDLVLTQIAPATIPETSTRLRAFRNNAGQFTDVTDAVLGTVTMVNPSFPAVADLTGDGRPDLVVIEGGSDTPPYPGAQTRLLVQTPDGRLADETATRLPAHSRFTHNVALADIDGDGDIDIFQLNINGGTETFPAGGPTFFLNNGSGVFSQANGRLPTDIERRLPGFLSTACALLDVTADGRPDLILGGFGDNPRNEILINNGSGSFVRDPRYILPPKLYSEKSVTTEIRIADLNADGAPDLVFATSGGQIIAPNGAVLTGYGAAGLQLLLNRGDGTFRDATADAGFAWNKAELWVESVRLVDLDGDGRVDIAAKMWIEEGFFTQRLFLNRGAANFTDASDAYMRTPLSAQRQRGFFHAFDADRDGRVDLVTATPTAVTFARNIKPLDRALFLSAPDAPGRLANLSVRTQAGTGDQTLITGFALGGAGTKSLLVRAVGPTLAAFGLTGTLPDPFVEIAPLNAAKVTENNNWSGILALKNAFASVGAFPLATDASLDAALVFSPSAGAYTAKITDTVARPGLALVEIYDTGTGNTPKLTNVSARTQVGTGADALIVGFVVSGNVPKKFLIRAVGPTLGAFGVGGTLVDPLLDVRPLGSENIVATNDDWRGTPALKAAFTSVGAFALATDTSRDAALAIELPPGAYTATVSGKQNTTGVALVEVYELP